MTRVFTFLCSFTLFATALLAQPPGPGQGPGAGPGSGQGPGQGPGGGPGQGPGGGPGQAAPPPPPLVAGSLRVGVAKVDITPADLTLNQMGKDPYSGVHDPIYARALVVSNGSTTTAIVALDLVDLPYDVKPLQLRVEKEVGIPADHTVITVTHDHSAPHFSKGLPACHAGGPPGGVCSEPANMDAYTQFASDKVIEALRAAKGAMQPAAFGIGKGTVDVNVNRDVYGPRGWGMGSNPDGPSDKAVWVAKFTNLNHDPIAILFNYGVHSTVTMDGQMVSGDLAGTAERNIEQRYGKGAVALFTMGAGGDQNPKFPEFPPPAWQRSMDRADVRKLVFAAMDAQGFLLGAEVQRVADMTTAAATSPRVAAVETSFSCPLAKDHPNDGIDGMVPIQLSLIEIGQVAFVGVGGEVVTNIETHLKQASPFADTIMMTIANGRAGYLVDDASYDRATFETHSTPAARGCVENGIVNGALKLMDMPRS